MVKPSELTPLTVIALQVLAARAGVPEGVFELVTADGTTTPEVGEEMCTNPHVRKVSFTGSTRVGKELMRQCSDTVKRLSLELGGNAAFIVFEDADVDRAVDAAMASKFRNAGQTCVCADRFLVHKDVEHEFVSKLKDKMSRLVVGHGLESDTTMGPLISDLPVKAISDKVSDALSEGASCLTGGKPMPSIGPNYFEPTLLTNVCRIRRFGERKRSVLWSPFLHLKPRRKQSSSRTTLPVDLLPTFARQTCRERSGYRVGWRMESSV